LFDLNIDMDYKNMLGDVVGIGSSRIVYRNIFDKSTVIKVQRPKTLKKNKTLSNLIEWNIWNLYIGTTYEKLFCPCKEISDDGVYLIQCFAPVLHPDKHLKRSRAQWRQLPTEISDFPDSRWYKNWGRLEDRYVLIDYGRENADRVGKRFHRTA
jgi:hypothetical protein